MRADRTYSNWEIGRTTLFLAFLAEITVLKSESGIFCAEGKFNFCTSLPSFGNLHIPDNIIGGSDRVGLFPIWGKSGKLEDSLLANPKKRLKAQDDILLPTKMWPILKTNST